MTTTEHDRGHEKFVNKPPHFVMKFKFKFNAMKLMMLIENEFKFKFLNDRNVFVNDLVKGRKTSFDKSSAAGGGGAP